MAAKVTKILFSGAYPAYRLAQ